MSWQGNKRIGLVWLADFFWGGKGRGPNGTLHTRPPDWAVSEVAGRANGRMDGWVDDSMIVNGTSRSAGGRADTRHGELETRLGQAS